MGSGRLYVVTEWTADLACLHIADLTVLVDLSIPCRKGSEYTSGSMASAIIFLPSIWIPDRLQYLIRDGLVPVPRMKSKLWLFNIFGMMSSYCVVIVLNFV